MRAISSVVFHTAAPFAGLRAKTRPLPNTHRCQNGRRDRPVSPWSDAPRITSVPRSVATAIATLVAMPSDDGLWQLTVEALA